VQCTEHTVCIPGEFVAQDATITSERVCSPCPNGTFSTTDNAAECKPVASCFAGTMVNTNPEPYQDRTCAPCPAGAFTDTFNKDECSEWLTCVPGQYVTVEPAASNDRQCGPVRVGFDFTAEENQKSPTLVAHCAPGFSVSAEPSESTDRECSACPEGSFAAVQDAGTCSPWGVCDTATGEFFVAAQGTPSSDVLCSSTSGCADGEVEFRPPTDTADRICVADPCIGHVCINDGSCVQTKGESGMSAECACAEGLDPLICATPCGDLEFVWIPANATRDTICGSFPIKLNEDGFPDQEAAAAAILSQAAVAPVAKNVNVGAIVGPILAVVALLLLAVLWRRGVLKQAHSIPATATLSNFSDQRAGYLNPRYEAGAAATTKSGKKRPAGLLASVTTTNVMYDNGTSFIVPNSPTTLGGPGIYMDADPTPGGSFRAGGAFSNVTYDTVASTPGVNGDDRDAGAFSNPTYSAMSPNNPSAAIHSAMNTVDAGLGLRRHSSEALYDTAADLEALQAQAAAVYDEAAGQSVVVPEGTYADRTLGAGNSNSGDPSDRKDSYLSIQDDENLYDAAAASPGDGVNNMDGTYSVLALNDAEVSATYALAAASSDGGAAAPAPVLYSVANPSADHMYEAAAGDGGGGGGAVERTRSLVKVSGQAVQRAAETAAVNTAAQMDGGGDVDASPPRRVDSASSYNGSERRLSLV